MGGGSDGYSCSKPKSNSMCDVCKGLQRDRKTLGTLVQVGLGRSLLFGYFRGRLKGQEMRRLGRDRGWVGMRCDGIEASLLLQSSLTRAVYHGGPFTCENVFPFPGLARRAS